MLRALTVVAVLLAVGALLSGAVAPPQARNDDGPPGRAGPPNTPPSWDHRSKEI